MLPLISPPRRACPYPAVAGSSAEARSSGPDRPPPHPARARSSGPQRRLHGVKQRRRRRTKSRVPSPSALRGRSWPAAAVQAWLDGLDPARVDTLPVDHALLRRHFRTLREFVQAAFRTPGHVYHPEAAQMIDEDVWTALGIEGTEHRRAVAAGLIRARGPQPPESPPPQTLVRVFDCLRCTPRPPAFPPPLSTGGQAAPGAGQVAARRGSVPACA